LSCWLRAFHDAALDALGEPGVSMHVGDRDVGDVLPGLWGTRATISRPLNFAFVRRLP
jgi:hypothetical protein